MKAVNHRYFDVTIKMPKKFGFFEAAIRNFLKKYVQRGKLDLFITYEDFAEENTSLKYNEHLAGEYLNYFNQMAEKFGLENDVRAQNQHQNQQNLLNLFLHQIGHQLYFSF